MLRNLIDLAPVPVPTLEPGPFLLEDPTLQDIVTMITTLGFPIVACLLLGWFVKYQTDRYEEELKEIRKDHRQEVQRMTEAINNNTLALTKLCERMGGDPEK